MQELISVLVMAAGAGERFGGRKQFLNLNSSTVLETSCSLFRKIEEVEKIFVVYPPDMSEAEVRERGKFSSMPEFIRGGRLREESVQKGLEKINTDYVIIHDAARPMCPRGVINRVIKEMIQSGAVVPAVTAESTVKIKTRGKIKQVNRNNVFLIQTPQGYRSKEIREAYKRRKNGRYTDSSSIAQEAGIKVKIVKGDKRNIKITDSFDYKRIIREKGGEKK